MPTTESPRESERISPCLESVLGDISRRARSPAPRASDAPQPPPAISAADVFAMAACGGLLAGWIESLYWAARQIFWGGFTYLHRDVCWMSPAAYLVLFAALGGILALLNARFRHPSGPTFMMVVVSGGAAYCVSQIFPELHTLACLSLAMGVAVQAARWFDRDRLGAVRWLRRTAYSLTAVVAAAATAICMARATTERAAVAALPAASRDAPHVLFVVLDTVRADALGAYGAGPTASPRIDALAQRGVLFEQASSTSSWTLPSTASLLTGRLPGDLDADWTQPVDNQVPTLAEFFRERGYATAAFVANYKYATAETGLGRGFLRYEDHPYSWAEFASCTAIGRKLLFSHALPNLGCYKDVVRKPAADINDRFLDWSRERRGRPYFAFLNYLDAHDPYAAPPPFDEHKPANADERSLMRFWWFAKRSSLTQADHRLLREAYADCIRALDFEIGRLLESLEERGDLENTIIVIVADHGEHFGEHDLYMHGNSLYEPLTHVPLLVLWKDKLPAGRRIAAPVSTVDLAATLQQLVDPGATSLPGRSLAAGWDGSAPRDSQPRPVIAEVFSPPLSAPCQGISPIFRGPMRSVRLDQFKLIHNDDGQDELFNIRLDPAEQYDLAHLPEWRPVLERLKAPLEQRARELGGSPIPASR